MFDGGIQLGLVSPASEVNFPDLQPAAGLVGVASRAEMAVAMHIHNSSFLSAAIENSGFENFSGHFINLRHAIVNFTKLPAGSAKSGIFGFTFGDFSRDLSSRDFGHKFEHPVISVMAVNAFHWSIPPGKNLIR